VVSFCDGRHYATDDRAARPCSKVSAQRESHLGVMMRVLTASLLVGAYSAAALPAMSAGNLIPRAHLVTVRPLGDATTAMRLRGGGSDKAAAAGGDQHRHAALAEQMGLGSHPYVLPLVYSMLAGLSTGIGGLLCLLLRGNPASEVPVTAFMLATAAAAMITVSIVDLFVHIAEEIGINHTLLMSITGALTVVLAKKVGSILFASSSAQATVEKTEETEKKKSEARLLRVGLLTAVTLTAHNLPEGMAVAISTMGSANLGMKLAVRSQNFQDACVCVCVCVCMNVCIFWARLGAAHRTEAATRHQGRSKRMNKNGGVCAKVYFGGCCILWVILLGLFISGVHYGSL